MGCGKGSTLEELGATIERDDQGEIVGVDVSGTQITDAGLEQLEDLTQLQELSLSDTQITDAGVAELQKALPNCEIYR